MEQYKLDKIDELISDLICEAIADGFTEEVIRERLQLAIGDLSQYFDPDEVEKVNNR